MATSMTATVATNSVYVPCAAPKGRKPLSVAFNVAMLQMASRFLPRGFDVGPNAPDDYDSLMAHFNATGRVLVDQGYADKTSFADAEVNYAFRAWHDATHIVHGFLFNFEGEKRAVRQQISDLEKVYGVRTVNAKSEHIAEIDARVSFADLLMAEIYGQQLYAQNHGGDFPDDQYAFTLAWLQSGEDAAAPGVKF